jgi:hypothetical protein
MASGMVGLLLDIDPKKLYISSFNEMKEKVDEKNRSI